MSLLDETTTGAVGALRVAQTRAQFAAARSELVGPVSVVMTMGALHEGHARLIRTARESSVGSMSKDTAMTPSSNSWATS